MKKGDHGAFDPEIFATAVNARFTSTEAQLCSWLAFFLLIEMAKRVQRYRW